MAIDRLRIGVIGLGWFGEIHCDAIVGVPNLELAALCTRTPERLKALARKFGVAKAARDYREVLADPDIDAVSIVTMWDQHTEPAIAALEAGKHVFLEKPIASTVEDARKIIAASERSKGILQVGHICRFNPRYRMAKQAIAAGKIGRIVAMSSRRNIPAAWTPAILNKIGPIVGDAVHDTDLMLWFTGDRIASAYAQTVSVRGLKHPDIGQTMYRFASGATATLETVWCMPEKTPFDIDERMSIIGDQGIIQIQDTFPNLGIVSNDKLHSPDTTYWPEFDGARGGALREEFFYFASCALKGRAPAIGRPEDAAAALAAALAAEESARTGQVVRIDS
ncbi:MAG: Gfo/Idh/MocA family oxidoreductase [Hyphomicrobiales bacterium]|nr:Gfo/Idh/MocA family oxidoreductase [Hyphomicrobiales bacterium]